MRKIILLAGVAAFGLAAPVMAKDHGGGRGHGGPAAQAGHGGHGGQGARVDRGHGPAHAARPMNRDERRVERAIQQERRAVRQARNDRHIDRVGDDEQRRMLARVRQDDHRARDDESRFRRAAGEDHRDWRGWAQSARYDRHLDDDFVRFGGHRGRRLAIGPAGCPPGLARQNVFCMPPGQLRRAQLIGQPLPLANLGYNVPARYRYRFADDGRFFYRYGSDGAVYRFDRASGLVSGIVPLASSGLLLGEPLPVGYDVYNVPIAYRTFYPDSGDYLYRYADNAIYRVDSESRLVDGIVALLTGQGGLGGLGIGDRLPSGYDVYNVPLDYRDTYYDNDDSLYRYADGAIYQVDPQTRLIESVISLLT